jgi:hypothetical protein
MKGRYDVTEEEIRMIATIHVTNIYNQLVEQELILTGIPQVFNSDNDYHWGQVCFWEDIKAVVDLVLTKTGSKGFNINKDNDELIKYNLLAMLGYGNPIEVLSNIEDNRLARIQKEFKDYMHKRTDNEEYYEED